MRNTILATLLTCTLAIPAFAAQEITMDTVLGTTMEEVQSTMTQMGYEVRKAEMEDGRIEVYFVAEGRMGEVYVDPETGLPVKIKLN